MKENVLCTHIKKERIAHILKKWEEKGHVSQEKNGTYSIICRLNVLKKLGYSCLFSKSYFYSGMKYNGDVCNANGNNL